MTEQIMKHPTKTSVFPQVKAKSIILKLIIFLRKDKFQTYATKYVSLCSESSGTVLVQMLERPVFPSASHLWWKSPNGLLSPEWGRSRTPTHPCAVAGPSLPNVSHSEVAFSSHRFVWVQHAQKALDTIISWSGFNIGSKYFYQVALAGYLQLLLGGLTPEDTSTSTVAHFIEANCGIAFSHKVASISTESPTLF